MPPRIETVDIGPRDGLSRVEATSFVNPERVPQMAGAEEVLAQVYRAGHFAPAIG